jgi:multidrug efflux pump subunit AcrB
MRMLLVTVHIFYSCRCRWQSGLPMVTSYVLSSTFVPVLCVWLLRHRPGENGGETGLLWAYAFATSRQRLYCR